jgi:RimJ/RimL family protein N-acetyltransferase
VSSLDAHRPVPDELRTEQFTLRPITADDAERDYAALMETRELLRLWEQSTWPADDFTVEANREDLVGLETRHGEGRAFTYTVVDPADTEALGCVYVFPITANFLTKATVTPTGDRHWSDVDAVVYFWMRTSAMRDGLEASLLDALRAWFREVWKTERTVFVTHEQFTQQVGLIGETDLELEFELVEPGKPGTYLVYGDEAATS